MTIPTTSTPLWLARDLMAQDDTLLLESDLIFGDAVLDAALHSECRNVALVAKYDTWMDGTMVKIDDDNNIVNFIPKKAFNYDDTDSYYKTVNIYKFTREFITDRYLPFLEAYIKVLGENEILRAGVACDHPHRFLRSEGASVTGMHWYEIDDVQDLRIAETIFAPCAAPRKRCRRVSAVIGAIRECSISATSSILTSPRRRMVEEMKANFEPLLRNYPSGMGVNSLLAAKYFGLNQELVVVGSGAAELIKSLMEHLPERWGVCYPTFEEYPNRRDDGSLVKFHPANPDFSYTASGSDRLLLGQSGRDAPHSQSGQPER